MAKKANAKIIPDADGCFCKRLSNKEIVILHSFIKKSQKIPKKELKIARTRLNEVKP